MENAIIELLSNKKNNNLKAKEIAKILKISEEDVLSTLEVLTKEGIVYKNNDRYMLVINTSLKKGTIKITSKRGIIVILDNNEELEVVYKDKKKLKNDDTVLVDYTTVKGVVKVVKIIDRKYYDFVAEVIHEGDKYIAISDKDDIVLNDIYPIGTKLLIDGRSHEVKEVLGHKNDIGMLEKEVLALNGFPTSFNDKYMEEVKDIPTFVSSSQIEEDKRNGLKDQRGIRSVTIDGDDTKDFDDAVSYHNGTIYVQIADPNRYIKEKGAIWDETLKRGISVYFPGCCNPMMHEVLSNGIASLVPGEDRYALSTGIKIDNSGRVINYRINEAVINNRKRMTYEDVNKYLEDNIIVDGYEDYTSLLDDLYASSMKVKNKMLSDGFLEFSSSEVKFFIEHSQIVDIKERRCGKAEELIEFLMLLHNICLTDYLLKNKLPFISRFHDSPNDDKLNSWIGLLKKRGYKINLGKKKDYTTSDIREVQKTYIGSREQVIYDKMAIMSQAKAKYSHTNIGHYALGLDAYGTGSSPIRRLSDTINERVVKDSLRYGVSYTREKWEKIMSYLARIATDAELRAIKAENKVDNIRKAEYIKDNEKEEYEVIVSSVNDKYLTVLTLDNMIYGRLYYNEEYFHLGKDGYSIVGVNGEKILIGDIFSAKLSKVNTTTGEIVFSKKINEIKNMYNTNNKKKVKRR